MILGIDTSCYTTSLALVKDGRLIAEQRRLLPVKEGECGLRQSEAFFLHIKQMPELHAELLNSVSEKITGICVSAAPRAVSDSYMPVFHAGFSVAKMLAAQSNVPLYQTTHQEGHLAAALYGLDMPDDEFLALHLSGGTTELLQVKRKDGGFDAEILGAADLAAGQMVDRIGVALDLPFPAGIHLEKIAVQAELRLPVSVKGCNISFSGPETAAQRLIKQGCNESALAYAVFRCIADSLKKAITNACAETGLKKVVLAGGVASNIYIRDILQKQKSFEALFAERQFASDNALGVALLGEEMERMSQK